ncbi:hypothetical protein SAMD00019534_118670, partial [Acytostelium subglobosum LB1]|uniref:hypothetical protein n=1 Tax=Acytostelium subglobosum LB1 TaxID=1410327 RepID=UPI000644F78B
IKTPCVDICKLDSGTNQCLGCSRTRNEIAGWGRMTDEERDLIIEQLPKRK